MWQRPAPCKTSSAHPHLPTCRASLSQNTKPLRSQQRCNALAIACSSIPGRSGSAACPESAAQTWHVAFDMLLSSKHSDAWCCAFAHTGYAKFLPPSCCPPQCTKWTTAEAEEHGSTLGFMQSHKQGRLQVGGSGLGGHRRWSCYTCHLQGCAPASSSRHCHRRCHALALCMCLRTPFPSPWLLASSTARLRSVPQVTRQAVRVWYAQLRLLAPE